MYKSLKIFFILIFLLMIILPNLAQSTNLDMNLTNNLDYNNVTNDANQNLSNTTVENQNTNTSYNPQIFQSGTTSSFSNLPEANLGLSNILSIILIVIGILLVLLAIAILIRLKH